ncbi:MAG: PaaI family thioesterase [Novosphingobium sp.]
MTEQSTDTSRSIGVATGFHLKFEDRDGWTWLRGSEPGRYVDTYGAPRFRADPDGKFRCRVDVDLAHANLYRKVNGGFMLSLVDLAVSVAPGALDKSRKGHVVTMSVTTNFIAPGEIDTNLDAIVEIVGETGRTLMLRGFLEQEGVRLASFEALMRKVIPKEN